MLFSISIWAYCALLEQTVSGEQGSCGIDREEGPDNAQWIILTHLIDAAFNRSHIHTHHVWKWSIWTGDVAQGFILWSHNWLMTLWNHHIMRIILIRLAFAFHWHSYRKGCCANLSMTHVVFSCSCVLNRRGGSYIVRSFFKQRVGVYLCWVPFGLVRADMAAMLCQSAPGQARVTKD